jgi:hypothetical protein
MLKFNPYFEISSNIVCKNSKEKVKRKISSAKTLIEKVNHESKDLG